LRMLETMVATLLGRKLIKFRENNVFESVSSDFSIDHLKNLSINFTVFSTPKVLFKP
jgi:hypothetical protein